MKKRKAREIIPIIGTGHEVSHPRLTIAHETISLGTVEKKWYADAYNQPRRTLGEFEYGDPADEGGKKIREAYEHYSKAGRTPTFLDIGCGDGPHVIAAAQAGFHATGLDLSPATLEKMLIKADARGLRGTAGVAADVLRGLPFEKESFDVIFSNGTLHHFDHNNLTRIMREIRRVVKPDGKAILEIDTDIKREFLPESIKRIKKEGKKRGIGTGGISFSGIECGEPLYFSSEIKKILERVIRKHFAGWQAKIQIPAEIKELERYKCKWTGKQVWVELIKPGQQP